MILVDAYDQTLLESEEPTAVWRAYVAHLRETHDVDRFRRYNLDLLYMLQDLAKNPVGRKVIQSEIDATSLRAAS